MNKLMAILLASIFSVVSFNALADHTPEHTKANASVEATPEVVKGSPEKTEVKKHPLKEKRLM
jgi:Cu/Ag efflux protein CusF